MNYFDSNFWKSNYWAANYFAGAAVAAPPAATGNARGSWFVATEEYRKRIRKLEEEKKKRRKALRLLMLAQRVDELSKSQRAMDEEAFILAVLSEYDDD